MRFELQIEKLRDDLRESQRISRELISERVLTYQKYRHKMEQEGKDGWNRLDMQAQLAEADSIIQLLLNNKSPGEQKVHRVERAELVIKNLALQEKVMIRDRIIAQKSFFPIYQYEGRVLSLRKAVVHWYRKAELQSQQLKQAVSSIKKEWLQFAQNISEQFQKEMAQNKAMMVKEISQLKSEIKREKSEMTQFVEKPQPKLIKRKQRKSVGHVMKTSVRHFR